MNYLLTVLDVISLRLPFFHNNRLSYSNTILRIISLFILGSIFTYSYYSFALFGKIKRFHPRQVEYKNLTQLRNISALTPANPQLFPISLKSGNSIFSCEKYYKNEVQGKLPFFIEISLRINNDFIYETRNFNFDCNEEYDYLIGSDFKQILQFFRLDEQQ